MPNLLKVSRTYSSRPLTKFSLAYNYLPCPDDIAIAQAINEIEAELNEDASAHRTSIFDADGVDVDLNEIDADLQQISTKEIDFENQGKKDLTSAEGINATTIYQLYNSLLKLIATISPLLSKRRRYCHCGGHQRGGE